MLKNIDESRPRFPFEQPDGAKKKRKSSFLLVSTQDKFLVYFYIASIFLHLYEKGGTVAIEEFRARGNCCCIFSSFYILLFFFLLLRECMCMSIHIFKS